MKRLAVLLMIGLTFCARAQNQSISGSITSTAATCTGGQARALPANASGCGAAVAVTVSGTWSGTLKVYQIADPNASISNMNTETWTQIGTITANGLYSFAGNGAAFTLVNATAFASGTANVVVATSASVSGVAQVAASPSGSCTAGLPWGV